MAFTFTVIPDTSFDQVISFTLANTAKDNQEDIHDSLSIEHTFSSGIHARITKDSNLILNPTARRGNAWWWDGGASTDYDTPTTDDDQALAYGAPNFDYDHWTPAGGEGPLWKFAGASGGYLYDLSEAIPIAAAITLTLSGEIGAQVYVAGNAYIDVVAYDVTNKYLGIICQSSIAATGALTKVEATGATPANTTYVRIRKWMDDNWDATTLLVTKLKIEKGTVATTYSDECSMPQYLSARYHMTGAGETIQIGTGVSTVIDFNIKDWDEPGTDRVIVDDGAAVRWGYTARRYQKLRVSARIQGDFTAILTGGGEFVWIAIRKNGALWSRLDYIAGGVITIPIGGLFSLQGSDTIELNAGDYLDILFRHDGGGNFDFDTGQAAFNYVSIEEI